MEGCELLKVVVGQVEERLCGRDLRESQVSRLLIAGASELLMSSGAPSSQILAAGL